MPPIPPNSLRVVRAGALCSALDIGLFDFSNLRKRHPNLILSSGTAKNRYGLFEFMQLGMFFTLKSRLGMDEKRAAALVTLSEVALRETISILASRVIDRDSPAWRDREATAELVRAAINDCPAGIFTPGPFTGSAATFEEPSPYLRLFRTAQEACAALAANPVPYGGVIHFGLVGNEARLALARALRDDQSEEGESDA